jgi:hypothetical protein
MAITQYIQVFCCWTLAYIKTCSKPHPEVSSNLQRQDLNWNQRISTENQLTPVATTWLELDFLFLKHGELTNAGCYCTTSVKKRNPESSKSSLSFELANKHSVNFLTSADVQIVIESNFGSAILLKVDKIQHMSPICNWLKPSKPKMIRNQMGAQFLWKIYGGNLL